MDFLHNHFLGLLAHADICHSLASLLMNAQVLIIRTIVVPRMNEPQICTEWKCGPQPQTQPALPRGARSDTWMTAD